MTLDLIRTTTKTESIVLSQRDGYPIGNSGVWFSSKEVVDVASATAAIFNMVDQANAWNLDFISIKGSSKTFLIMPVTDSDGNRQYFLTLSLKSKTNLAIILVKLYRWIPEIQSIISRFHVLTKIPNRAYGSDELRRIHNRFDTHPVLLENSMACNDEYALNSLFLQFEGVSEEMESLINRFSDLAPETMTTLLASRGGLHLAGTTRLIDISNDNNMVLQEVAVLSAGIYDISERLAYFVKKMRISQVTVFCRGYTQVIMDCGYGVLLTSILQNGRNLALNDTFLSSLADEISNVLKRSLNVDQESDTICDGMDFFSNSNFGDLNKIIARNGEYKIPLCS